VARPTKLEGDIPMRSAGAIRLFPPSSQGLAACGKSIGVQIAVAFPSVPRCHPPFVQV